MVIRSLVAEDEPKIRRIVEQMGIFNKEEIRVALGLLDEALSHPEMQDYYVRCAVDEFDSLAGYICFGPIPLTDGCYDLYWIAVDKRFSRQGVGGKLLEHMEDFVVKKKARRIYVDTSSTPGYEAARSFYEKHGYRVACILDSFYRQGDDKIILVKEL
jgi:ribosomal protein S18 acetylase RimI-like enzyme